MEGLKQFWLAYSTLCVCLLCVSVKPFDLIIRRFDISYDPEKWLSINRDTGEVTAKRAFNIRSPHVQNNVYRAMIEVSDAGESSGLTIIINNNNNNNNIHIYFSL